MEKRLIKELESILTPGKLAPKIKKSKRFIDIKTDGKYCTIELMTLKIPLSHLKQRAVCK